MRVVLLLCIVVVVTVEAKDACIDNGGKCLSSKLCPKGLKIEKGGCNEEEICCTATSCHKLGGECITECPDTIIGLGKRANDCPKNNVCCIWL